jgi:dihydroneopterin aldolase
VGTPPPEGTAPSPDRIELRGLRLTAVVGVLPEERDRAQPLEVDLDVHLDLSAAAASDRLEDTVDYGAICDRCARVAATAEPLLLERLAGLLAEAVLGSDPRIDSVSVSVRKLRPPVPHDLSTSGVRILRRRSAWDGDR